MKNDTKTYSDLRQCVVCGGEIIYHFGRGRPPICCSDECRRSRRQKLSQEWHDRGAPEFRLCRWCLVTEVPSHRGPRLTCSAECHHAHARHMRWRADPDRCAVPTCPDCGRASGGSRSGVRCADCRALASTPAAEVDVPAVPPTPPTPSRMWVPT